jgi:hypothetical protein
VLLDIAGHKPPQSCLFLRVLFDFEALLDQTNDYFVNLRRRQKDEKDIGEMG